MKTAGVVENSAHCVYSIGLSFFLKLPFAVSFSVLYTYIYICIIIRDNVAYGGFRVLDIL